MEWVNFDKFQCNKMEKLYLFSIVVQNCLNLSLPPFRLLQLAHLRLVKALHSGGTHWGHLAAAAAAAAGRQYCPLCQVHGQVECPESSQR